MEVDSEGNAAKLTNLGWVLFLALLNRSQSHFGRELTPLLPPYSQGETQAASSVPAFMVIRSFWKSYRDNSEKIFLF